MKFFKMLSFLIFHSFNYILSISFIKSKYIWVYGEWFGKKAHDNSYYAFKAGVLNKKIKKIWITESKEIIDRMRSEGERCYHKFSIKGLYYQARAGVFFCCVNSKDFCFSSMTPRSVIFQLWHGLPMKKIGFDVRNRSFAKRALDLARSKITDNYTYIISPSPIFDKVLTSAFKMDLSAVVRSNLPRCDGFYCDDKKKEEIRKMLRLKSKYVFFYLPTHRDEGRQPETILKLIEFMVSNDSLFKVNDITLIIKPHYYEVGNYYDFESGNVRVVTDFAFDLYSLLSISDALITDYSSVAFDYMVTGKPIFYYAPDYDEYISKDREMYFDYKELFPCFLRDKAEFECAIKNFVRGMQHFKCYPPIISIKSESVSISDDFQRIVEHLVIKWVPRKT